MRSDSATGRRSTDEITDRMLIAGMQELYRPRDGENEYQFVARIFLAMRAALPEREIIPEEYVADR